MRANYKASGRKEGKRMRGRSSGEADRGRGVSADTCKDKKKKVLTTSLLFSQAHAAEWKEQPTGENLS